MNCGTKFKFCVWLFPCTEWWSEQVLFKALWKWGRRVWWQQFPSEGREEHHLGGRDKSPCFHPLPTDPKQEKHLQGVRIATCFCQLLVAYEQFSLQAYPCDRLVTHTVLCSRGKCQRLGAFGWGWPVERNQIARSLQENRDALQQQPIGDSKPNWVSNKVNQDRSNVRQHLAKKLWQVWRHEADSRRARTRAYCKARRIPRWQFVKQYW